MRIACLVMVHEQPQQFARLLEATADPPFAHYVHCDRRRSEDAFRHAVPVGMSPVWVDRHAVRWAGYSQVSASLTLLRRAVADGGNTHFYLLSGRCLPIRPMTEIAAMIEAGPGDWMDSRPLPIVTETEYKPLDRLERLYFMDLRSRRLRKAFHAVCRRQPRRSSTRLLHGLVPTGGQAWWLLTRETAERALAFLDANRWYEAAFRHTLCADEMFYQTLLTAVGVTPQHGCPTGAVWSDRNSSPETLTPERVDSLREAGYLFGRKFSL